jgi:uncharacterized protein YdaU (DUF1376 family)
MHYYSFNIGDYTSHTAHLSPVEDIAYRRLLDLYYQTESPISKDIASVCRQIRMREYSADVQQILSEFFTECESGWVSARCHREIDEYKSKADKARSNGKLGGRPKKLNESQNNQDGSSSFTNKNPEQTQTKANQEPLTINQEPLTKEYSADKPLVPAKASRTQFVNQPEDVSEQVWKDWLQLRKTKKAAVTETVVMMARKEAEKARMSLQDFLEIWCVRGSQGLKAEWLKDPEVGGRFQGRTKAAPQAENFASKDYGKGIQLI